jgi:hypothetical protein
MKLSEIFTQLVYGELSQLAFAGTEPGTLDDAHYNRIVSHVNLGLTALYKRFPLKESRLTVALQPGQGTYQLHSNFAVSKTSSAEPVKYILDSSTARFGDDIHKVERVYTDSVLTPFELGLNDLANAYALRTPSALTLWVPADIVARSTDLPEELLTTNLEVVYRANHPILPMGVGMYRAETVEIELPYSHLDALLLFIVSRVNNPIGSIGATGFHAGNNYAAKYEQECQRLSTDGLTVDQGSQNTGINRNGWV